MIDLDFHVEKAQAVLYAAAPVLSLKLRITAAEKPGAQPPAIHSILLRCQVRIEPTQRRYQPAEQERLTDLFAEPARWHQTLRSMLWMNTSLMVPAFTSETLADLLLPCTFDFNVAATKYFEGLDAGDIPICLLFSGTIFYATSDQTLQVAQIPWEKEANFRLPVAVWKEMMNHYYPNTAWLCLQRDAFDQLHRYKRQHGIPTWEQTIETLLAETGKALR